MRTSQDQYASGFLWNGFDYARQAWVKDGKYLRCGHPENDDCGCYGRLHEGENVVCDVETMKPELADELCECTWEDGDNPQCPLHKSDSRVDTMIFTESPRGYEARERWARAYDELNGAPESDGDR